MSTIIFRPIVILYIFISLPPMLITRISQLLVVAMKITPSYDPRAGWSSDLSEMNNLILSGYFDKVINIVKNIDIDILEYIKNTFEPTFKRCGNNIEPISIDPKSKSTENFFFSKFTLEKLKELAKEVPRDKKTTNDGGWIIIKAAIFYHEILKVLLDKRTIPSVKLGNNTTGISLNAMINWALYSVEVFIGEEEFEKSEDVASLKKNLIEIRDKLNTLLKEYENSSLTKSKLKDTIRQINAGISLAYSNLDSFKIESMDIILQEKKYQNLHNIIGIITCMVDCMTSYVSVVDNTKEWRVSDGLVKVLIDYLSMIYNLFIFSISMDKLKEMSGKIKELGNSRVFNLTELESFDIFKSYGINREDYKKNHIESNSRGIGTIILIGCIVMLVLAGGGGIGIYYLTRESKEKKLI